MKLMGAPAEVLGLTRIRRRRLVMFALFLLFVPVELLVMTAVSVRAAFLLFPVWAVAYLVSGFAVIYSRCPRCGELFHQGPFPWPYERRFLGVVQPSTVRRWPVVMPTTRRCLNCGLGLKPHADCPTASR